MLKETKQHAAESIKKAKNSGKLTVQRVYEITRGEAADTAKNLKAEAKDLRRTTKDLVTSAVQSLKDAEDTSREKVSAALHGTVDGVRQVEKRILDATHAELSQTKARLQAEEAKLAKELREILDGARDAAGNFSGEVKSNMEIAVTDAKLKSTELLGLTREAVKAAVGKSIESGTKVEEAIVNVTRDATAKGLAEARLSAERARKVSETVLSAAVEAAEELNSHVKETASAATEGVRQGLTHAIERTRDDIGKAGQGLKAFAIEDLRQTKDDLEVVGDLFIETLRKVADRSGEVASDVLHELAEDAQKGGSKLREKAKTAAHAAADHLKELGSETLHKIGDLGSKTARAVSQESKELGTRMLAVAKGAAGGMWEGAKSA